MKSFLKMVLLLFLSITCGCDSGKENEIREDWDNHTMIEHLMEYRARVYNKCFSSVDIGFVEPDFYHVEIPKMLKQRFTTKAIQEYFNYLVDDSRNSFEKMRDISWGVKKGDFTLKYYIYGDIYNGTTHPIKAVTILITELDRSYTLHGAVGYERSGQLKVEIPYSLYHKIEEDVYHARVTRYDFQRN